MIAALAPDLSAAATATLVVAAYFTAALTAAVGLGGGVLLLALMALILPAPAIVPLHGVAQLASNAGRSIVQGRHARASVVAGFAAGTALGVSAGGRVALTLPPAALQAILAGFLLYAGWGPKPRFGRAGPWLVVGGGIAASFLTMFVGATGPFVMAVLVPATNDRLQLVGSHALAMTLQHGLKVAAFGALGFGYGPWLGLLGAMIGAGFLGTLTGAYVLKQTSEARFRAVFRGAMTTLAIALAARALWAAGSSAP